MTDATHDDPFDATRDAAAPGDDETLVPDDAPETGPLTPDQDPDGGGEESPIGSPP